MQIESIKLSPIGSRIIDQHTPNVSGDKTFGQFLSDAVKDVNSLQKSAETASVDLAAGKIQDIAQVAIAQSKADVALQLTLQVRNKVVDAYQEIMRISV
ncbi:MAG: flagellar hook-basal body complex protein FliE [Pelosinus sp.]|nr:flagellar hook-basal body complex protein FliE [Pelosinus sp.]